MIDKRSDIFEHTPPPQHTTAGQIRFAENIRSVSHLNRFKSSKKIRRTFCLVPQLNVWYYLNRDEDDEDC